MRLLAVETTTRCGSVALWEDGTERAFQAFDARPAEDLLVPVIEAVLAGCRPDAIAIAVGPGSFTGLRVGVSAVRALAWCEDLPVHPVDTLEAIALAHGPGLWWVLLPLKRDTTFQALVRVHEDGHPQTLLPTSACLDAAPPDLPAGCEGVVAVGPALVAKPDLVARWRPGTPCGDPAGCDARAVARAARYVSPVGWAEVLPRYHQTPAPVLQRAARGAGGASSPS